MASAGPKTSAANLGLSEAEAVTYRAAVELGLLTAESVAAHPFCRSAPLDVSSVRGALDTLAARKLVTPVLGRAGHFEVVDPSLALGPQLSALEQEVKATRAEVNRLSQRHRRRENASPASFVEVIQDVERAKDEVMLAHRAAKHEVLAMERAPYQGSAGDLGDVQASLMAAGVVHRVLYDLSEVEDRRADIEAGRAGGEQSRGKADLPLRAMVIDRRVGFVPGRRGSFLVDPLVIVHEGSLLDAIVQTFEACWATAVPLGADTPSSNGLDQLVSLMAAGLTDDAIARQLQVSRRTVQRQISNLMRKLGVHNRFQAGLMIRESGILGPRGVEEEPTMDGAGGWDPHRT